ncbi:hypothetical protein JL107_09965 [Nakamurella flavida]|uniref:Uncharacterized protein n=1 Tax=Nakamurella flavida TaxID=363630 RepID=A0A938YPU3_9ACTN|nr:hypothetical protein [Nakamurella flavida]MBM9476770.1 hypothetical protein [Nakamurella flavida]MDP9778792.1 hypothetical protein [Nakamurella flavida]
MVGTRHGCPEPLKGWLEANGQDHLASAGLHPLVTFTLGAAQEGMPPLPADVLAGWALTLVNERVMLLQSTMAYLDRARRAGMSDPEITRSLDLVLPAGQTVTEYSAGLLAEVEDWRRRVGMVGR